MNDFDAVLAHELANPIAAVAMAASSLRKRVGEDADTAELVRIVEDQAAVASTLIADLLSLRRAGGLRSREALHLGAVVDDVATGIAGLDLENRCHGVTLVAHRVAVERALANLLSNAVQHGGGEARVSCETSAFGHRVEVADRGRRAGGDTSGHGLGLGIVAAVAAAHDGSTGRQPRPGGGSVYWFEIGR